MKTEIATLVERALVGAMPFLALRGLDSQARTGGDLDYLVPSGAAVRACQLVAAIAREQGWLLLQFRDIRYLATVVLTRPSRSGHDPAVKVDFFSGLEWYGVGDGSVTARLFDDVVAKARSAEERATIAAAVTFLQKGMTVGGLSQRDVARVRSGGASPGCILDMARMLELPLLPNEAGTGRIGFLRKWRLRAASGRARDPVSGLWWLCRVTWEHFRFKAQLGFQCGILLTLSGMDGSGKSTQLDRLSRGYETAGLRRPREVHLLPAWIPMPHQIVRRRATLGSYVQPYREAPVESPIGARLRLAYYVCAFILAKLSLDIAVTRGQMIVADRGFTDFASDLSRARIPHRTLPSFVMRVCTPHGQHILIDAEPEVVALRKRELTLEKARELRRRYLETCARQKGHVIDGNGPPEEVYASIVQVVDQVYMRRITARAGNRPARQA
jgi:thymidylate kinase